MIRRMVRHYDPAELAQNESWMELLALYDALKQLLPQEYLHRVGQQGPIPVRRRNGGGGMAYFDDDPLSHLQ